MTRPMPLRVYRCRVILRRSRQRRNDPLKSKNVMRTNTRYHTNHLKNSLSIMATTIIITVNSLTAIVFHQVQSSWTMSPRPYNGLSQTNCPLHKITEDTYTLSFQTVTHLVKGSTRLLTLFVHRPHTPTSTIMAVMWLPASMPTWSFWPYLCTYRRCTCYAMKDEPLSLGHCYHNNNKRKSNSSSITTNSNIMMIMIINTNSKNSSGRINTTRIKNKTSMLKISLMRMM